MPDQFRYALPRGQRQIGKGVFREPGALPGFDDHVQRPGHDARCARVQAEHGGIPRLHGEERRGDGRGHGAGRRAEDGDRTPRHADFQDVPRGIFLQRAHAAHAFHGTAQRPAGEQVLDLLVAHIAVSRFLAGHPGELGRVRLHRGGDAFHCRVKLFLGVFGQPLLRGGGVLGKYPCLLHGKEVVIGKHRSSLSPAGFPGCTGGSSSPGRGAAWQ